MKKVIFTIIVCVLILTFFDYYNAFEGNISKDEATQVIGGRLTTLFMVLLILFLYRKNIHYIK